MQFGRVVLVCGLLLAAALSGCLSWGKRSSPSPSATPDGSGPGVNETLHVDFSFTPIAPFAQQVVQFTDLSYDDTFDIVEHAWDFGDGHASTAANPTHQYSSGSVFLVTLRAKNAAGSQATATHNVTVRVGGGPPPTPSLGPGGGAGFPGIGYLTFGAPVTVKNVRGGEPSLAIDSKGVYYVSPPGFIESSLYKSTDDGKTFSRLNHPKTFSGDSHVITDRNDRVWLTDLQSTGIGVGGAPAVPVLGPSNVWTSTDGGSTWIGNVAASDTVLNDRQWLAAPGAGAGYLLFRVFPLEGRMTKTTDAGLTWLPLSTTFEWTSFPFVNRKDGTLYVVESAGTTLNAAVSTDGGGTFSRSTIATRDTSTEHIFVNGAVDDTGNAYVAWTDKDSGRLDIYMSYSTNRGADWKGPFLVSAGVGTHVFPWIAAGGDGRVVVAWYGTNVVGDPNKMGKDAQWHVYAAQSLNAHDPNPVFAESRANPDPIHEGAICMGGTGCGAADRDLLDFFTVEIGPDGRAAVTYSKDGAGDDTAALFALQTGGPRSR